MNDHLTDITLVVDRSGSMENIKTDAEGGINTFINLQKKQPGQVLLTLVQFDNQYEFLHKGVPIGQVEPYSLVPRGSTALLDAVGRAIRETGERLGNIPENDRPGLVVFVIMTDGLENASQEFTKAMIREMVQHQQQVYSWQFTFLGANQDAFEEARSMGMDPDGACSISIHKVGEAMLNSSEKVSRMRRQKEAGAAVCNAFTESEINEMR